MPTTPEQMVEVLARKLTREEFCDLYLLLDGDGPAGPFWEAMGDQAQHFAPNMFEDLPADPLSLVKIPRPSSEMRALIMWRDGFSPSTISGDDRIRQVAVGLMDASNPRVPDYHRASMSAFQSMTEPVRMGLVRKVILGG